MTARGAGDAVIGVDLGGTKCHGVLAAADGRILAEQNRATRELPDPADLLLWVVDDLRAVAERSGRAVAAVAIGIPAFVDPGSGLVVGGFNLGWDGFDLRGRLDADLVEPYVVENDVNLAALGEARVGSGRGAHSFVTIALGTGLGGAVVVDGTVLRGAHGAAGELGFLMAGRDQLRRPGVMGMESVVGGWAIAGRARGAGGADRAWADAAAVFAAADAGNPAAAEVVDEVLDHLAMTIVDVAAVVDPELVVLDGSIGRALAPHLGRLADLVTDAVLYPPDLRVSTLEPTAVLAGAVVEARRLQGQRRAR